jgi:soluble lytic murein transglycosylase-like protein
MTAPLKTRHWVAGLQTFALDVREGFVEITHHGMALLGLVVVVTAATFLARPSLQASTRELALGWLQMRQIDAIDIPPIRNAANRATTQALEDLTPEQRAVTHWLSRKYRVATEPLAAVVAQAWVLGERAQLAPSLILAIVAVESRFNPLAAASQGAVGLMQIEVKAHADTLGQHGGTFAAFDPLTNLRVGVRHLQALVQQTTSLEEALALYGEASGQALTGQYVERVLAEQKRLDMLSRP